MPSISPHYFFPNKTNLEVGYSGLRQYLSRKLLGVISTWRTIYTRHTHRNTAGVESGSGSKRAFICSFTGTTHRLLAWAHKGFIEAPTWVVTD